MIENDLEPRQEITQVAGAGYLWIMAKARDIGGYLKSLPDLPLGEYLRDLLPQETGTGE